jgi:hypothetical protein
MLQLELMIKGMNSDIYVYTHIYTFIICTYFYDIYVYMICICMYNPNMYIFVHDRWCRFVTS